VMSPDHEWADDGSTKKTIYEWTRNRGHSPRLYPGSLIWCIRKQGRDLQTKVETLLAWRIVERDYLDGSLAGEFDASDRDEINAKRRDAESAVADEVWAGYRYVVLYDPKAESGVTVIDLGAGHANAGETLSGRVISTLKSRALLNDSPGAGYLVRRWPEPFKKSGAWPVSALRQAFLNGTMERLLEPDDYIKHKFPEFIFNGDFGYASGAQEGGYYRIWFKEELRQDEISFDSDVYLLLPEVAKKLTSNAAHPTVIVSPINPETPEPVRGEIPTEVWNRLGRTLIPKLKMGGDLSVGLNVSVEVEADTVQGFQSELTQILRDLNIADTVKVDLR